jgi:twinkle protein
VKQPCPRCRATGKDTKGDHLAVFPDGGGFCHAGHGSITKEEIEGTPIKPIRKTKVSSMKLDEVAELPIGTHPDRKIPALIAAAYGVRTSCNTTTGEPHETFYPLPAKDSKDVIGYKVRRYPKEFRPNVGGSPTEVWGKPLCKIRGHHLLIVEGEEDCMAANAILSKGTAIKMDVVSLPNGASVSEVVKKDADFFTKYKRVYINLDPDTAGKKAQAELCDWMSGMADVYNIVIDGKFGKDASDYWAGGHYNEYRRAIKGAELFTPDGVVNGIDILLDELLEPVPEGYTLPFEGVQRKLHGVRKAEILTVCAGSGIGKSTVVREITKSLIEQKLSVANVALEDQMNVAAQALIALDMEIPLAKFRFSPPSKEEAQPHYDKMVGNGDTYFYKHFGGLTSDTLMDKMYYYAKSKEVDFIILDHLSMVISASNSNNERQDIDKLMTNLAQMVVETGVGLIQIVHLKRSGGEKSFAKGGEVELTDLRGSAALEQLSWAVMALERDQQGEDPNEMVARILKNRTWGFTGLADYLRYEPETGRTKSFTREA